jgi:hypothetical protein
MKGIEIAALCIDRRAAAGGSNVNLSPHETVTPHAVNLLALRTERRT